MRDYANSSYQRRKVAPNKVKIQRKPLDLSKYLRSLKLAAGGFTALVLTSGLLYGVYRAIMSVTLFPLKNIEVSSATHLTRDEILGIAGVEQGKALLRMNLKTMGEHLQQNPWIEAVRINRHFPDTVSIAVTEREPVAIVNIGYIYYLDKKGKVFKVLNQGDSLDFPIVTGFSEEELSNDPKGTGEALEAACELLKILHEKGAFILADVSEIHYDTGYGFTLFTASGSLPVKVGSGDFSAKIERFARIYKELSVQLPLIHYIDLDYNDKIIIKKS
ncbi:MAG: FtsQ-type POTRA domain-containing protein [Desulfuromonadaceae bacterium]|nr:FtsQ-type POTRA domain-containing protein [Desulfuromonadaceae bacterium]MDD5105569.1 FtsQ-type POTRA domain-containing protein [Desulfuromonadaceae bacterium]